MSRSKAAATVKNRVRQTTNGKRWMICCFEFDGTDVHGHVDCWQWPNTKFGEAVKMMAESCKKVLAEHAPPGQAEPQRDSTSGW